MARKSLLERIKASPMTYNLATLAVLTTIKSVFDFEDPLQLMVLRLLAFACQVLILGVFAFFYFKSKNDPNADKIIHVRASQLEAPHMLALRDTTQPDEKTQMTQHEYDMEKLRGTLFQTSLTTMITMGFHFYGGYAIPLIMSNFAIIRSLIELPFFDLYVKGKDDKIFRELRRPWPQKRVTGMQKFFQDNLSQQYNTMQRELENEGNDPTQPVSGKASTVTSRNKKKRAVRT